MVVSDKQEGPSEAQRADQGGKADLGGLVDQGDVKGPSSSQGGEQRVTAGEACGGNETGLGGELGELRGRGVRVPGGGRGKEVPGAARIVCIGSWGTKTTTPFNGEGLRQAQSRPLSSPTSPSPPSPAPQTSSPGFLYSGNCFSPGSSGKEGPHAWVYRVRVA